MSGVEHTPLKPTSKKAIENRTPEHYFVDLLTPVFGHCTEKGNQLIAENLAQAILSLTRKTYQRRLA